MKTNRTSSIAKKRMREKGDTSNRPEQLLLKEILQYHVRGRVETEAKLENLKDVDALTFTGNRSPRPDILLTYYTNQKFVIRVNGPYHDSREKYDRAQKLFLEMQEPPYIVIDVSYVRHEILFERNKRKLTRIELLKVLDLIRLEFAGYGIFLNPSKTENWLRYSEHRMIDHT